MQLSEGSHARAPQNYKFIGFSTLFFWMGLNLLYQTRPPWGQQPVLARFWVPEQNLAILNLKKRKTGFLVTTLIIGKIIQSCKKFTPIDRLGS